MRVITIGWHMRDEMHQSIFSQMIVMFFFISPINQSVQMEPVERLEVESLQNAF